MLCPDIYPGSENRQTGASVPMWIVIMGKIILAQLVLINTINISY